MLKTNAHGVDNDEEDANRYSKEHPPRPHICIETVEQVGNNDSREDHSLKTS